MKIRIILALGLCLSLFAPAHASDVDNYQNSWIHRAHELQRELGNLTPLAQAPFLGTHNSYNSSVWSSPVRYVDPNQSRSLYDQLRMDVRALELEQE